MNNLRFHVTPMTTTICIRNIPESRHKRLKARAAAEGVSMSRLILREIERALERPTRREWIEAIRAQSEIERVLLPAEALRDERRRPCRVLRAGKPYRSAL